MDTLVIKVRSERKNFLLELLSQFAFVETESYSKKSALPVVWAEKPDIADLFSISKTNPVDLSKIRQVWKRNR